MVSVDAYVVCIGNVSDFLAHRFWDLLDVVAASSCAKHVVAGSQLCLLRMVGLAFPFLDFRHLYVKLCQWFAA